MILTEAYEVGTVSPFENFMFIILMLELSTFKTLHQYKNILWECFSWERFPKTVLGHFHPLWSWTLIRTNYQCPNSLLLYTCFIMWDFFTVGYYAVQIRHYMNCGQGDKPRRQQTGRPYFSAIWPGRIYIHFKVIINNKVFLHNQPWNLKIWYHYEPTVSTRSFQLH